MWKKGQAFEEVVAHRLKEKGWTIVARNVRYAGSELDLIARNQKRLICVEVKARKMIPDPSSLLSPRKIKALARGLQIWLSRLEKPCEENIEVWLCCIAIDREPRWLWFNITDLVEGDMQSGD